MGRAHRACITGSRGSRYSTSSRRLLRSSRRWLAATPAAAASAGAEQRVGTAVSPACCRRC